jgi:hypothetical protein
VERQHGQRQRQGEGHGPRGGGEDGHGLATGEGRSGD